MLNRWRNQIPPEAGATTPDLVSQPEDPPVDPAEANVTALDVALQSDELPPNPIEFEVTDSSAIYTAAEEGKNGNIARSLLARPLDGITLEMNSALGHFELYGTIDFLSSDDYDERKETSKRVGDSFKRVSKLLGEQAVKNGTTVEERGGNLIVSGEHGTRLVVGRGRGYTSGDKLHVTTGYVKEGYDSRVEVLPAPALRPEAFKNALDDTLDTLALTLYASYVAAGLAVPEQRIPVTIPNNKREESFGHAQERNTPKDISDEFGAERPKVSFDEIGGQDEAKREIKGLAFALSNPELYKKWGTKPPKGVLLHGPPGTGKTLLAKALASEADAAFYPITATDITSKWYGNSEKHAQRIFDAAAANDRAIIYFDELDAMAPNRDGAHEASQRVISVILQNMDGMNAQDHVLVVASTNRKNSIDDAILRPGRLDRHIETGLPNETNRAQIFDIHIAKSNKLAERQLFSDDVSTETLASLANDFSGADIAEIIRRTLERKVREEGESGIEPSPVSMEDLQTDIQTYERAKDDK